MVSHEVFGCFGWIMFDLQLEILNTTDTFLHCLISLIILNIHSGSDFCIRLSPTTSAKKFMKQIF